MNPAELDLDPHLEAIAAGDAQAFAAWLAGAEWRIRSSLTSFAGHVDTEAVLQEALLRVWQVAPRVRGDGRPNALLRLGIRVARNLAVSELRRQRVRPRVVAELEARAEVDLDASPPDPLLRRVIATCRAALPAKPGLALAARLGGGRSDAELAASLGMKLNTFLQNFTRARQLLAQCLAKQGIEFRGVDLGEEPV